MRIGSREPIPLDDFTQGYLRELDELERLVSRAEELAALTPAR
jgi:hypothetical protein